MRWAMMLGLVYVVLAAAHGLKSGEAEEKGPQPRSGKPEHATPVWVSEQKLIALAKQALLDGGLEKKYSLGTGLYVATPSQMGENMVVFCLVGAGTPETGERAVDCVVHVSALMGKVIRVEELGRDEKERLVVKVNDQGKATGYRRSAQQPAPDPTEYRVTRHDFFGNLWVYLAGENDGFVVYMPVPQRPIDKRLAVTVSEGLRIQYTPYRFKWDGPFFTGAVRPSDELKPESGSAVLEKKDGKLLFSLVGLKFDGKSYATMGPVEVTLGVPARP